MNLERTKCVEDCPSGSFRSINTPHYCVVNCYNDDGSYEVAVSNAC